MTRYTVIPGLDPATYERHPLHGEQSIWVEKNCYVDLWIEVLHALKLEPLAILPFVAAIDFEGDQWTFFKPPLEELREMFGLDVQELTVWRPLLEHAQEHLAAGKLISSEADAFWLPDTSGTDYRRQHSKTTIVMTDLDVDRQQLGYFHNAGYYRLEGEDFRKLFRLDSEPDPAYLPLFAEFIRSDRRVNHPQADLVRGSARLWCRHLARRPATNPVARFRDRFEGDLPLLQSRGLAYYHIWAFGTIRQLGSAFELAAANLKWLTAATAADFEPAIQAFELIASSSKTMILKAARAVNAKRGLDGAGLFSEICAAWDRGMQAMDERLPWLQRASAGGR